MKKILKIVIMLILIQTAVVSISYAAPAAGGEPGGNHPNQDGCDRYHTVQYGDTVYSIGRLYGVNPQQIISTNSLVNADYIYVGQRLYIPCSNGYGHQPQPYPGEGHYPAVGYGYDFTGYYYETYYPGYRRYSYTCGYHYNCY